MNDPATTPLATKRGERVATYMRRRVTAVWCLIVGVNLAHAEVLELDRTVKAVDATTRTITIERKTPKGTKALELEVAKKAGDLGSVKRVD